MWHCPFSSYFIEFFTTKFNEIRKNKITSSFSAPTQDRVITPEYSSLCKFTHFDIIFPETIFRLFFSSKPSTCLLDPIPSKSIKELFPILRSLTSETVSSSFKTGVIRPLPKKHNLDPDLISNYRPITNLPFFSKLLEKVVVQQLIDPLPSNNLLKPH